ncbi:uncharacterized protein LOC135955834 [Calliphora vicina]|uniref:uncharacterized protein LOC135955834 n=1 Tax=Calliphora vicina TaxID=7373 RepID=UPI00325B5B0D
MSDTPQERNSNSKSNLIEVQHVGVTAKLQSPLKSFMLSYSSSTDSENNQILYRGNHHSNTKYNKFLNEATNGTDTTLTENSKILYEMKSVAKELKRKSTNKLTPSKIEFQLYTKPKKRLQKNKSSENQKLKRQLFEDDRLNKTINLDSKQKSIFQRLKYSLNKMKNSKRQQQAEELDKIFNDFKEPENLNQNFSTSTEIKIGIYPFEHGCADYLKTHDCPPQLLSLVLAERATSYATRFWAEFFGSLQIAVAFIVTFLLQLYRFVLYSLVNIFVVEFLHMTSDYLVKPLLTVLFNGFLQPPLIFCFNILSSLRDILEPIADTLNNFMKPVATVGRSIRLIHATYNKKNIAKTV